VTLENVAGVVAAGARAAAVIAAIENAPDPTAAGRAIAVAFVAALAR
jgi:thiamine monophosphate synthase